MTVKNLCENYYTLRLLTTNLWSYDKGNIIRIGTAAKIMDDIEYANIKISSIDVLNESPKVCVLGLIDGERKIIISEKQLDIDILEKWLNKEE